MSKKFELDEALLKRCAERAPGYDRENRFCQEDFDELKAAGYLLMTVPEEFGGYGMSLAQVAAVTRQLAGLKIKGRAARRAYVKVAPRRFDLVVLDAPPWAKSPFGAVDVVRDYPTLFRPALLATRVGGNLLVTNNAASVRRDAWIEVLRRSAEKVGRPIRDLQIIEPDDDFPSPDGQAPLKMAWLSV